MEMKFILFFYMELARLKEVERKKERKKEEKKEEETANLGFSTNYGPNRRQGLRAL